MSRFSRARYYLKVWAFHCVRLWRVDKIVFPRFRKLSWRRRRKRTGSRRRRYKVNISLVALRFALFPSFTSTSVRLSHWMLSLSLTELELSVEQSQKDIKAVKEERECREKELTRVRGTFKRNTFVCLDWEQKKRVDTVKALHFRLNSPGSTAWLIYYGCIQAVHKSTVAAPTWTKWRFADRPTTKLQHSSQSERPQSWIAGLLVLPPGILMALLQRAIRKKFLFHRSQMNTVKLLIPEGKLSNRIFLIILL